jgi:hypothetical protein
MVSVEHPKPLGLNQENTNYDVAASKLFYPLCSIVDAVSLSSKGKKRKMCRQSPSSYLVKAFDLAQDRLRSVSRSWNWT